MADKEFKPATCAADVSDWITPEDVTRLALEAFDGECTRWRSEPDPDAEGPGSWYTRVGFAESLIARLEDRFRAYAHDVGVLHDPRAAAVEAHHQAFPDWVTTFEFKPAN